MIVAVNGFVLNDPTSGNGVYLDEPIDGLSLAPVRTSQGNYSGRDGGWVGAQFYAPRLITLNGTIKSASVADFEATRRDFEAAVALGAISLEITTNGGSQYVLTTYIDELDIPIQRATTQAPFQLTLIAPDPIIYDNSAGGANTFSISPIAPGGVTWPLVWPVVWAPGSTPSTVINSGEVLIYPKITLNNKMTNPIVTNVSTGQFIKINGLTTAAGDVVVIDMKNRTVLLNGSPILTYVDTSSSWWGLVPGSNSISLTTSSSGDTVTGSVAWQTGYRGI